MKPFLNVAGIVAIATVLFIAGFKFGTNTDFTNAMMNTGIFEDQTNNAIDNLMILEWISENESNKAVSFLNSKLNVQIIFINDLLPEIKNEGNRKVAKHILSRAAKYRMKYPSESSEKDINEMIKEILFKDSARKKN